MDEKKIAKIKKGTACAADIKKLLPKGCKSATITDHVVNLINNMADGADIEQEQMFENFAEYVQYMEVGRGVTIEKIVNAIKFCTLTIQCGISQEKAYSLVFPEKYEEVTSEDREIRGFVSAYASTKTVTTVQKMMVVPVSLSKRHFFDEALMKNVNLMRGIGASEDDKVSPMIQQQAAKTVLEYTKPDEEKTINVKVGKSDDEINEMKKLNNNIAAIVQHNMNSFKAGMSIEEAQKIHYKKEEEVIEGEIDD